MATRPVFIPRSDGPRLHTEVEIEFTWHPGFSDKQKRKSIRSLHQEAEREDLRPLLEISTKSESALGRRLSAFNLHLSKTPEVTVESAYQGSKEFEEGGPYRDLYQKSSREAKTDERLQSSGDLIAFDLKGKRWPLNPKTAFYDWLYLKALQQHVGLIKELRPFAGFTDIEFNPEKSVNCQARAAAIGVSLSDRDLFDEALESRQSFLKLREQGPNAFEKGAETDNEESDNRDRQSTPIQGNLFE